MFSKLQMQSKKNLQGLLTHKMWLCSLFLILFSAQAFAQPANDEPCNATVLTVGATCNFATYDNTGATASAGVPAPGCAGYSGADVWFSFVVPAGGSVIVDAIQGVLQDCGMALYSGTCSALTLIECDDDDSDNGAMPKIIRTGLTPGSTVYVRFWDYGGNLEGTFGICVTTPPPPPANDECAGAIAIPVNADLNCTTVTPGTTVSATPSAGVPAPGCNATGANDDVWFSFVATSVIHNVAIQNVSGNSDRSVQVLSGTCGSLVEVLCSDPESFIVNGLTIGATYYLRVYTTSASSSINSIFNICITTPPPPPANDECAGAIPLTVNADLNCGIVTQGTTEFATGSTGETSPTCAATGANDDIWFSFVATGTVHQISIQNVSGSTDRVTQLYSGSCGNLVAMTCSDPESFSASGLTAGQTYYLRIYTWSSTGNVRSVFNVCVGTPPPPPANDECSGAISLTVNQDMNCGVVTLGTTELATASTSEPTPTCFATGINDDVWYSFVATGTSHIISYTNLSGSSDMITQVYSGTCGSLVPVVCSDPETVNVSGLTAGQTYYVRVYTWSSSASTRSTFNICVGTPPPPPANDDCAGAIALTVNADLACAVVTQGTTLSATASTGVPNPTCGATGGANDDVWFSFVATGTAHQISLTTVNGSGDRVMQVYSGTCGSLVSMACSDPETMVVAGLTAGQTYYVRVFTYSSDPSIFSTFNICVGTPPPPPANDDCANAVSLTVNPDLNCGVVTQGTTENATPSTGVTAPTCATTGANDDVWYSFVATGPAHVISYENISGSSDMNTQVYSGSCGNLVAIMCSDPDPFTVTGLTAGETYYVRVYTWSSTSTTRSTFNICVGTPPPPPSNDDCAGAISLTVNPDMSCTVVTQGTTISATGSTGVTTPTCFTGGTNDDVWYSFVAVTNQHIISYQNISGSTDMITQIYSGTCGSLVPVSCHDPEFMTVNGLTPGETYYVRVYTWSSSATTLSTFNICVGTMPTSAPNDDCDNAINVPVNPDLNCGQVVNGSTAAATSSTANGAITPSCNASGANDDVWYSFVATDTQHEVSFSNVTGPVTDLNFEVYSGTCAGGFTSLTCSDPNSQIVTNLTVGATYYVRVWTYTSTASSFANFSICIGTPPPPPANDEPCGAFLIDATYSCNYQTFNTQSASGSSVPGPGCANYAGGDVWFKVVVPCGGALKINTIQGDITDAGMALYTGTCGNLTLVDCDDDGSENGLMPLIIANGLPVGDTVYIRFWEYGNNDAGTFGICVTIPPPPPAGSDCATANPFCTSQTYSVPNTIDVPSMGGSGIYDCLFTTPNPAWYYMQVQTAGDIIIGISQTSTATGAGIDVDYAVWGPFTSLAAACNGLTEANNISCSYSPLPTETATIMGAQAGEFYMILLTNYSNQAGTITFQQTGGTGSSSCANICTITASNSGPACPGGTVDLTTPGTTDPAATYSWVGPNCFTSTAQNPTGVTPPSEPGTYVYTVTVSNSDGTTCHASTSVIVNEAPQLPADSSIMVCVGGTVDLYAVYDTTGLSTVWTLNGGTVGNPGAVDVSGIYQLVASNGANCSDTAYVTVVIDTVAVSIDVVDPNCVDDGTLTVNPTSGIAPFMYAISNTPGVPGTPQALNEFTVVEGTYEITTIDSLGCSNVTSVTIAFDNNLEVTTVSEVNICNGQSATLTTTGNAVIYSWSPALGLSDPNIASPVASPTTNTVYTLTATLGSCTTTVQSAVTIGGQVTANAGPDISIVSGEQATLQGSATGNVTNISWTPATGLSNPNGLVTNVTPTGPGTTVYTLTVTNALGCEDSDEMTLTVVPYCIKVKNAFSPNGDGINDQWVIYDDYGCLRNIEVRVFNRYGNLVYHHRDYRNSWDGTYKGKPIPDGTYYAVIDFTMATGRKFTTKTDLTIIR